MPSIDKDTDSVASLYQKCLFMCLERDPERFAQRPGTRRRGQRHSETRWRASCAALNPEPDVAPYHMQQSSRGGQPPDLLPVDDAAGTQFGNLLAGVTQLLHHAHRMLAVE